MTDMLAEMKAEREVCIPGFCRCCDRTARALDVAIEFANRLEKEKHAPWVERLLAAAQAKWEGK